MRNPFRSEAEAFQFLVVTVAVAAAIVLASLVGGTWWGVGVAIVTIGAVMWWYWRTGGAPPPVPATPTKQDEVAAYRVLVVANETVGGSALRDCIRKATEGRDAEVLVVVPALNSRLKHWASDEDEARVAARERLDASIARLSRGGITARGEVGDSEPLQAVEDALRTFGANEIIISTHPEGRSNWLEQGLVDRARQRFAVPITHVVVDLEAEPASDPRVS
jgi:hypothetical protein